MKFPHTCAVRGRTILSIEPDLAQLRGTINLSGFTFEGTHSAYSDFIVRRQISGGLKELDIAIKDRVTPGPTANTPMVAKTVFHAAEGVVPTECREGVILTHQNSEYQLLISCDVPPRIYYGLGSSQEETSVIGTSFGQYENSYSIHFPHQSSGNLHMSLTADSVISP